MTDEELQQMFAETARIRELANPAAVPYSDFQVPTSNAAPSSFGSNLGGLLFGGADSGLNEYLSRDQQKAMQNQALMSAAMSLLKNSGWTTQPVSIGQALGSAYEAGTAGYQGAQKNAIEQLMTKQKLDEYNRKQQLQQMLTRGLIGDQVAPAVAAEPQTAFPRVGETISPLQSQLIGGLPLGPTNARAALIGQQMPEGVELPSLPEVTVSNKPRPQQDIFGSLSPQQKLLVAMNPDAMLPKVFEESMRRESFETITGQDAADLGLDPRGKYQINNRTNQVSTVQAPSDEYEIVTGANAVKYGLPGVGSYQLNKTTRQATLVGTAEGPFGGGTTGLAYNILLTEDPSSAKYALAYRELSKPVPTIEVQADGSERTVYRPPAPLPPSFPKPSYKGKIPTPSATTAPATIVQPSAVSAPAPARRAITPPVAAPADGAVVTPLAANVKSTPFAPQPEEIKLTRKAVNQGVDFVAALDKMENMVRSQGMQLGGVGDQAAAQEVVYEDLLTKIRIGAELGVLNKEDLPRIQAQLGSPTALSTFFKGLGGPSAFYSQIAELRNKVIEETTRKNLQFGQPIMQLPSTFTVTRPTPVPVRPVTPPAILKLLDQYPGRSQ
jgi:hypothetical protein